MHKVSLIVCLLFSDLLFLWKHKRPTAQLHLKTNNAGRWDTHHRPNIGQTLARVASKPPARWEKVERYPKTPQISKAMWSSTHLHHIVDQDILAKSQSNKGLYSRPWLCLGFLFGRYWVHSKENSSGGKRIGQTHLVLRANMTNKLCQQFALTKVAL